MSIVLTSARNLESIDAADCSAEELQALVRNAFRTLKAGESLHLTTQADVLHESEIKSGRVYGEIKRLLLFEGFRNPRFSLVEQAASGLSSKLAVVADRACASGETRPIAGKKLKILHMVATARGATWVCEQLYSLKQRGHEVEALIYGPGPLQDKLEAHGIKCLQMAPISLLTSSIFTFVAEIAKTALLFRRGHYDVVQYHLFETAIFGRFAAWLAGVPVRVHMLTGPFNLESPILGLCDRLTATLDTRTVPSCLYSYDLYAKMGVPPAQLDLIYYGADAQKYMPQHDAKGLFRRELVAKYDASAACQIIGMVAYFYPPFDKNLIAPRHLWGRGTKDHETLIDAMPHVLRQFPEARLVLVGDGWGELGQAYIERLRLRAENLGLSKSIHFLGHRTDVDKILQDFDVSIQCSLTENLGGTLESSLAGVPLVCTITGGMTDLIEDGKTGFLATAGDPVALAGAINRALQDPAQAGRLAENARARVLERFNLSTCVDGLESLYQECRQELKPRHFDFLSMVGRAIMLIPKVSQVCWLYTYGCFSANLPDLDNDPLLRIYASAFEEHEAAQLAKEVAETRTELARDLARTRVELARDVARTRTDLARDAARTRKELAREISASRKQLARELAQRRKQMRKPVIPLLIGQVRLFFYVAAIVFADSCNRTMWWLRKKFNRYTFASAKLNAALQIKRLIDIALSSLLILVTMPLWIVAAGSLLSRKKAVLQTTGVLGLNNTPVKLRYLAWCENVNDNDNFSDCAFWWLPSLVQVLFGQLSLIGTRLRPADWQPTAADVDQDWIWRMRPGLIGWSHFAAAKGLNCSYELDRMDLLYMGTWNHVLDCRLSAKALVALLRAKDRGH